MHGIIEFAEKSLNIRLYPVQKVVLKTIYGEPLDDREAFKIPTDWRQEKYLSMTEAGYLQYLYEEGRSNVREPNPALKKSVLVAGRRVGKSFLETIIMRHEIQKLVSPDFGDPHARYGLSLNDKINVISVTPGSDLARYIKTEFCALVPGVPTYGESGTRFRTSALNSSLRSPAEYNVRAMFLSSYSPEVLRGLNAYVLILDEAGHMTDRQLCDITNACGAYVFFPKKEGKPSGPLESRVVTISSPGRPFYDKRKTLFQQIYEIDFRMGTSTCFQIPTWEMNPTIPAKEYSKHYDKDPLIFEIEFGARFLEYKETLV